MKINWKKYHTHGFKRPVTTIALNLVYGRKAIKVTNVKKKINTNVKGPFLVRFRIKQSFFEIGKMYKKVQKKLFNSLPLELGDRFQDPGKYW